MTAAFLALCVPLCLGAGDGLSSLDVSRFPSGKDLPDPFLFNDGTRVATPDDWARRRSEIKEILLRYEYGHVPPPPEEMKTGPVTEEMVLDGTARKIQTTLLLGPEHQVPMRVCVYVPANAQGAVPVVLAVEPVWESHLLPVAQRLIERGYAFAGYDPRDLDADGSDPTDGIQPLYPDCDWATVAVWSWGALRAVDYLVGRPEIDARHIAITGHSRWGKAALLAGALDERIALTAPHASGAGGTAAYRFLGPDSESLALIVDPKRFHYWFVPRLASFAEHADRLPFDQHFLEALVAPRALLTLQGTGDLWSNPLGTRQAFRGAQPVFDFLGVSDHNAIFWREGGHDTTPEDWDALLDYVDHVFFGKPTKRDFRQDPFPDAPEPFTWTTPSKD